MFGEPRYTFSQTINPLNVKKAKTPRKGFTLIELLVAVVVIGILASIVVPSVQKYVRNSRATAFANDVRILARAGQQYSMESGWWVEDTSTGEFPSELDGYFSRQKFELGSPLGGEWDFEQDDLGDFTSAVGVVDPSENDEVFAIVDKRIDDGDLASGFFQKVSSNRYYFAIEE